MGHASHPSALAATPPTVTGFGRSHHHRVHEDFPSSASLMGWQPSPGRAGQKWSVSQYLPMIFLGFCEINSKGFELLKSIKLEFK
jgi:hypothetical protein